MAWETFRVAQDLKDRFVESDFPADDGLRRELAASVARVIDTAGENLKTDPDAMGLMDAKDWKRLRAWVKELDPALAAPPAGGEADRPAPRPRRRSSRR